MATESGRVHPNCVNASNPYHECGMACLEKVAQGQGHKELQKVKSDYHNGIKGVINKKKNEERKVNPNCIKASNPYHECGEHCFKRNGEADARGVNKESGSWSFGRKKRESGSQPDSPRTPRVVDKASVGGQKADGQHARSEYYPKKKVEIENGNSFSSAEHFSREIHPEDHPSNKENVRSIQSVPPSENVKMNDRSKDPPKESVISPTGASRTSRVVDKVAVGGQKADAQHARSEYYPKKKVETENGNSFSSAEHVAREIHPEDHSFNMENVRSIQSVPSSENVKMNDRSKYPPKESVISPTGASLSKNGKDDNVQASHEIYHSTEDIGEYIPSPTVRSRNFSFSGIDHITPGDSDDEEAQSVISDCVSVGKYHVRASISSILQSIINKYGDIAANCKLESNSMRAYYLECLCSVVQELQSTSLMQITKAKVREMLAVLKDVETAQIDVSWLRNILNEISEVIELSAQHKSIDAAKANCDNLLESTRKELESQMKELALKEKEAANLNEQIAETKSRLETIQAAKSKFSHKSLADDIL